jgi:hypothetical protein
MFEYSWESSRNKITRTEQVTRDLYDETGIPTGKKIIDSTSTKEWIIKNGTIQGWKPSFPKLTKNPLYTPTVAKLRMRDLPDTKEGKTIRSLLAGEKLVILELGKKERINDIDGRWIAVLTEKGETGYTYGGYVEKMK